MAKAVGVVRSPYAQVGEVVDVNTSAPIVKRYLEAGVLAKVTSEKPEAIEKAIEKATEDDASQS
jgi:hypothetical protein